MVPDTWPATIVASGFVSSRKNVTPGLGSLLATATDFCIGSIWGVNWGYQPRFCRGRNLGRGDTNLIEQLTLQDRGTARRLSVQEARPFASVLRYRVHEFDAT